MGKKEFTGLNTQKCLRKICRTSRSECPVSSRVTTNMRVLTAMLLGVASVVLGSVLGVNTGNVTMVTAGGEHITELVCMQQESELFRPLRHRDSVTLGIDEAALTVVSDVQDTVVVCIQSQVCHKCALLEVASIKPSEEKVIAVNTHLHVVIRVTTRQNVSDILCMKTVKMDEHGNYSLYINPRSFDSSHCNFVDNFQPPDNNIPIYAAIAIYGGVALIYFLVRALYKRGCFQRLCPGNHSERLVNSDLGIPGSDISAPEDSGLVPQIPVPVTKKRLRSLDTFRGLSLVIMIFVNYGGGEYWFFHHAAWDGLTVADLVFPWFVFIMGTSMAIAFNSQLRRGIRRKKLFLKVFRRSVILFALGLMVSNRAKKGREVHLHNLRIPGVLQRLAFTYFIVALLEVIFGKVADHSSFTNKWWVGISDVVLYWPQWLVALALLVTEICITFLLPVPGCPTGYLGPGGLHDNAAYTNCTGGAAGHIDRWLLGPDHIYQHPTTKIPYVTQIPYDPEGLLGTLTSIFLCFLGLHAGKVLLIHEDWRRRSKRWLLWCLLTGVTAGILCEFSQYDGWIPLNKNLWSVSFILAMAAMAYFLLTICYIIIDVLNVWSGAPFFYLGMNSIVVYLGSEVLSYYFPVQFQVRNTHTAQLAMALWGATFWTLVAVVLYLNKVTVAI